MDLKQKIYSEIPVIETERLVLRKLEREDAADLFEYASDPAVPRFMPWEAHNTIEETNEFITFILEAYENQQKLTWAIELKETRKMIGTIDFVKWLPKHGRAEIAYALSRDYWGLGFMPEAARALIAFGFDKMDLNKVEASILLENAQSRTVLEKMGMSFEGVARQHFKMKDEFVDLAMYSLLKSEFLQERKEAF